MSADIVIVSATGMTALAFMAWAAIRGRRRRRTWLGAAPPPDWWRRRERGIGRTRL